MATYTITCSSLLHNGRSQEVDWSATLGYADHPINDYKCGACARLDPPSPEQIKGQNRQTLIDRATLALTTNDAFLNVANPNNTQVLNQVKTLTKECSAIIRLLLDEKMDDITGT
jgi:hypothetical protein